MIEGLTLFMGKVKNKLYILTLIIMFCLPLLKVNAFECTTSRLNQLKKLAQLVKIEYSHVIPDDEYIEETEISLNVAKNLFEISVNNLTRDIVVELEPSKITFSYGDNEMTPSISTKGYFSGGQVYTFNFYVKTDDLCNKRLLKTETMTLPMYNIYFDHPLCKGAEEYYLCNKWVTQRVSEERFIDMVNKYKQEKNKIEDNNKYSNLIDKVIDLLLNNYMYILISIVSVVIVIIIIIIYRRRDKIL